jgi:hypothetical protein
MGEAILQILSSLCQTSLEKFTSTDKKQLHVSQQGNSKKTKQLNIVLSVKIKQSYHAQCIHN